MTTTTDPFAELDGISADVVPFIVSRPDFRRTKKKQPYVIPAGDSRERIYTRVTTYASSLSDTYSLTKWQLRMAALGLADNPRLIADVIANRDERNALDGIADTAQELAGSKDAANYGTELHLLTEWLDTGDNAKDFDTIPERFKADAAAYLEVTAGMLHHLIEGKCVNDDLALAGTFDRLSTIAARRSIVDLKTGGIDYAINDIAVQLAIYANSDLYDPTTHARTPMDVDLTTGIIIHVPANTGTARLVEVDIAAGWEAAQLAAKVRAWRSRKDLARDYTDPLAALDVTEVIATPTPEPPTDAAAVKRAEILAEIAACDDVAQLEGVYALHLGTWTDALTHAAAERKAVLLGGAA